MLKNYFKIAWRNLTRNRFITTVNIGGLAIGMTVAALIGLWILNEFNFNKSFDHYDRLGRIVVKWNASQRVGYSHPLPLGIELGQNYRDVFEDVTMALQTGSHILASGKNQFSQPGTYMQRGAPKMFSLKMIEGSQAGLASMNSIMINQTVAKKLFGNGPAINKVIRMDNHDNVQVTGVFKDFPLSSEFNNISFIAPWDLIASQDWMKERESQWQNNFLYVFVVLKPNENFEQVSARIKGIKHGHVSPEEEAASPNVFVHPMSKWHLYSAFGNSGVPKTSEEIKFIWFYGTIGFFVLLLACINFMNLSTARSEKRAREVGIRKAIGSLRRQLVAQFYSEALLISFFALSISILFVYLALPWFNTISGKDIRIPWSTPGFWIAGIGFTVITGLLAGSYPALYLSSFNPVKVLKGTFRAGRFAAVPRKALVVLQFTVSVALIVGTVIVYRQIQFTKDRPVGYTQQGLLMIPMRSADFYGKFDLVKSRLLTTGAVVSTCEAFGEVTNVGSENGGFEWKGKDPRFNPNFATLCVSQEYGATVGWQFVGGRDFLPSMVSDSTGLIINESAAIQMGLKDPVGETLTADNYWLKPGKSFKVLGVVKDMVMNSPFERAVPTIFFLRPESDMNWIFVRMSANASAAQSIRKISGVFKTLIPTSPFDYQFADESYASKFASQERIGLLAGVFAGLAVLISCLGLFGLAGFVAEQRTKEIGLRKVLGASVFSVWKLLSGEFVLLVAISCLIAIPLAGYFMRSWLQQYEYRTALSWWIFGGAVLTALFITLVTISYQAIKAGLANPVNSLRAE